MVRPPRSIAGSGAPAFWAAIAAGSALSLASCGPAEAPAAPPPPPVQVMTVSAADTPNAVELPGRIEAVRSAEVRARVDGIVQRQLYTEGADVPADKPLFQIDPAQVRAQLQQAQANLVRAQAVQSNAAQIQQRFATLIDRKAVSALEFESAQSNLRQADAAVMDAKAAIDQAKLRVGWSTVRAPIAGRVGRAQVSEGSLVSAAGATLMTNVDQLSPVYATFTKSSSDLLDLAQRVRSGEVRLPNLNDIEVRLIKENGEDYGLVGHMNFHDLTVTPSTGSQIVRAEFPNPNRDLLPGQFVRGVVMAGVIPNSIAVPQRAIAIGPQEASVMVVGADNAASRRVVDLGGRYGDLWVVRSGLKPGEKIIVEGWQRVQPGQKVTPLPSAPAAAAGPGG
jgi:RND family efflux transporter MFP subunit